MLGYRSYFTVAAVRDGGAVGPAVLAQIHAWLRSKNYDADRVQPGTVSQVAADAEATLTVDIPTSGGMSLFFALRETRPEGTWITQVIACDPGSPRREPWVWTDIDAPRHQRTADQVKWTAPPRLVRALLEILDARDGGAILDPSPRTVTVDEVPALITSIRDPSRRGPIFVAGSDSTLPMQPWRKLIAKLLHQTTGLAAAYVLDAAATKEFSVAVGDSHAVSPGTMRTFVEDVVLGDDVDSRRHRVLTTDRIVRDSGHRVVRLLGGQARDMTLTRPVPHQATRVEKMLLRQVDDEILSVIGIDPTPQRLRDSSVQLPEPSSMDPAVTAKDGQAQHETVVGDVAGVELQLAVAAMVQDVLGSGEVTPENIARVRAVASSARQFQAALDRKEKQFEEAQERVGELSEQLGEVKRQLSDEQLEHGVTSADRINADRDVLALRIRLQSVGFGHIAWTPAIDDEVGQPAPESFDDLVSRFGEFAHVTWTGDPNVAVGLDIHDPLGGWAGKTWSALRALDDYAELWLLGKFAGSVHDYLLKTPAGRCGYSSNRHARDEGEDVKNNDKYRAPRMLRTPDGKCFMGAHFKIAQFGMISPRMHYHNGLSRHRKIFIGYIGPHLPTSKTN